MDKTLTMWCCGKIVNANKKNDTRTHMSGTESSYLRSQFTRAIENICVAGYTVYLNKDRWHVTCKRTYGEHHEETSIECTVLSLNYLKFTLTTYMKTNANDTMVVRCDSLTVDTEQWPEIIPVEFQKYADFIDRYRTYFGDTNRTVELW